MDPKQTNEIIERLELGEPLSKITRDKKLPTASTVYKYCRDNEELHKRIMNARQTGVWTLLDKIAEDMEIPKTPQETHFLREKYSHIRWLASKLASNVFGDKIKSEIKQDSTLTVTWGVPQAAIEPGEDAKIIELK
tara:strand:- start:425 stop:832 length:408 start_codon:yes stop_codon:yes gene_type:complete